MQLVRNDKHAKISMSDNPYYGCGNKFSHRENK